MNTQILNAMFGKDWKIYIKEQLNQRHASDYSIMRKISNNDPQVLRVISEKISERLETMESDILDYLKGIAHNEVEATEYLREREELRLEAFCG